MRRRTLTSNDAYSVGYILSFLARVANVYFPPKHIYFPVCYLACPQTIYGEISGLASS